jgi:phosphatidylglycerophosphate synthase
MVEFILRTDGVKKHIPKIMLLFSLSFFAIALITFIYHVGYGNSLDHNQQMRLTIQFIASGLFLGLYRIVDLLDGK